MNRREIFMMFIAGAVSRMVGVPVPETSVKTNKYQIALWLIPALQWQWQIWEIISYLSTNYSTTNCHIPIFPPHATLCTGNLKYDTQEELEDKKKQLFESVGNFCRKKDPLPLKVEDSPNQFGRIGWWSQFFHYRLKLAGWPEVEPNTFKPLTDVKLSTSHENASLMPHVSLMYCPNSSASDLSDIDFAKKINDQFSPVPDQIVFDAISVVTPGPTNDWEEIVTKPPQQWKVIYTTLFGAMPPQGTLEQVVAGGQTGVDTAALRAGWSKGLAIAGWCPPDGRNLDGKIPVEFLLKNTPEGRSPGAPDIARSLRTQRNTRDSDATLILRRFNDEDSGEFSPGAITNPEYIVTSLMHSTNRLTAWIWNQFSQHDKEVLEDFRSERNIRKELLAANFNTVIRSASVSDMRRFDDYKLSEATVGLLQDQNPSDTFLLKRRLLEDALPDGFDPALDRGTLYTCWSAVGFHKPVLMSDPNKTNKRDIDLVVDWIKRNNVKRLNVGGPAKQTVPGIDKAAYNFLSQVFARARKN